MTVGVQITVDVEVWPPGDGRWPHVPLPATADCREEIAAFLWGDCNGRHLGLPYQLEVLARHGLRATFFVDPMFSFALGLQSLRDAVNLIQSHGQRVELHLHPEWITDPRSPELPRFNGPMIGDYDDDSQYRLICVARDRLVEAGAVAPTAFRAGNWGANRTTLRALLRAGIMIDSSLNATHAQSLPDLPRRESYQRPFLLDGVSEVPVTRFEDGVTAGGRPLSLVGVGYLEMRHVLECLKTERINAGKRITPRRLVMRRFEGLCRYLAAHRDRFETRFVADHDAMADAQAIVPSLPTGRAWHTSWRMAEQLLSRWY
jgi:hypothetical protein